MYWRKGTPKEIDVYFHITFFRRSESGRLPDIIFIQVDGGSENISIPMLVLCELLVARGLTKEIYLTRLPVKILFA